MHSTPPCRTYIMYRNELFGQAVRSLLERDGGVSIVGMESDLTQARRDVRKLRPEVILVEEPMDHGMIWPCVEAAGTRRIVTLSLEHVYATVYDFLRTSATDPAGLAKTIQGSRPRPTA